MRILLLSDFFYPHVSGGAIARFKFAKEAVKRGNEITVFSPIREDYPKKESKNGVQIIRPLRNKPKDMVPDNPIALIIRLFYSVLFFFVTARWLKENRVDCIHTTEHIFHPVGKLLGKIFDISVLSFVGYTPSLKERDASNSDSILEKFIFKCFLGEKVLCRSGDIKKIIEKQSDAEVEVIHGVVNLDVIEPIVQRNDFEGLRKDHGFEEDEKIVTMVGRLTPVKNVQKGVEILSNLPENYRMVIVGDGPEREDIEKKADELSVDDRVKLFGRVEHEKALEYIGMSDLVMLTSKAEAYPTVVFEALVMGKKVLAPPVGILDEIAEKNLFVEETDRFEDRIENLDLERDNVEIDREIASKYSIERYTEDVLKFIGGK